MREITYVVGLLNARSRYNPQFLDNRIDVYLNFLSEWFAIRFRRISDYNAARYRILFGAVPGARTAAVTSASKRQTTISESFPFGRNDQYCARVLVHEFGHCLNTSFVHLSGLVDVMSVYGGTAGNLTKRDCDYFFGRAYAYKGSRRPWYPEDANKLVSTFSNPVVRSFGPSDESGNVATVGEGTACHCCQKDFRTTKDRFIGLVHAMPFRIASKMGLVP